MTKTIVFTIVMVKPNYLAGGGGRDEVGEGVRGEGR